MSFNLEMILSFEKISPRSPSVSRPSVISSEATRKRTSLLFNCALEVRQLGSVCCSCWKYRAHQSIWKAAQALRSRNIALAQSVFLRQRQRESLVITGVIRVGVFKAAMLRRRVTHEPPLASLPTLNYLLRVSRPSRSSNCNLTRPAWFFLLADDRDWVF